MCEYNVLSQCCRRHSECFGRKRFLRMADAYTCTVVAIIIYKAASLSHDVLALDCICDVMLGGRPSNRLTVCMAPGVSKHATCFQMPDLNGQNTSNECKGSIRRPRPIGGRLRRCETNCSTRLIASQCVALYGILWHMACSWILSGSFAETKCVWTSLLKWIFLLVQNSWIDSQLAAWNSQWIIQPIGAVQLGALLKDWSRQCVISMLFPIDAWIHFWVNTRQASALRSGDRRLARRVLRFLLCEAIKHRKEMRNIDSEDSLKVFSVHRCKINLTVVTIL